MARETRGSTARDSAHNSPGQTDAGAKRKRRTSSDAFKSESDGVTETPESKRQRRANGTDAPESDVDGPAEGAGRLLSKEVRDAIAVVLAQMAKGLPPPINNVLTLWLPPDFVKTDENTLGWLLKQDTLTWEKLHATLHLFAENLLLPCAYPNPVPSLARMHLPVPPLPSQFPPLIMYSFCAALRDLLLQVEPLSDGVSRLESDTQPLERWALMQKTPGGGLGTASGDWFTSAVNLREVEAARKSAKLKNGQTLLGALADGKKFGNAEPVLVQATGVLGASDKVPTLSESVIRRASLKAQRWKETRALRRANEFSNVLRPVTAVTDSRVSWTPSFAPTYNSQGACGLGYYSTLDLMHENARHKEWLKRSTTVVDRPLEGWTGSEDKTSDTATNGDESSNPSVDDILESNADLINELQIWQELRVRKGDAEWVSERERAVADELFASLAKLVETTDTPPSALLPENKKPGLAHTLAKRLLANDAPAVRGTLDARRPQALHDNVTIRLRGPAAAAVGQQQQAPSSQQGLGVNGVPQSPRTAPPKTPGTPGAYLPSPQMREQQQHLPQPQRQQQYYQTPSASRGGYQQNVPMLPQTPQAAQMQMRMPQGYPQQQVGTPGSPMGTPMAVGQQYARPGSSGAPVGSPYAPQAYGQTPNYQRQPLTAAAAMGQMSPQMGGGMPMGSPMGQGSPLPQYPPRMVGPGPSNLRQSYGPMPTAGMPGGMPTGLPPGVPTMPVMYGAPMQHMRMPGVPGVPGMPQGMPMGGQMGAQMGQMQGQMGMHHR